MFNPAQWIALGDQPIPPDRWARLFKAMHGARVAGQVRSLMWKITVRCLALRGYAHFRQHFGLSHGRCVLCDQENETYTHLFVGCGIIEPLWMEMQAVLEISYGSPHLLVWISNFSADRRHSVSAYRALRLGD